MYQGDDEGDEEGCHQVDENGVCRQVGGVSAEPLGNDRPRGRRGADEANHGSFHEGMCRHVAEEEEDASQEGETARLH